MHTQMKKRTLITAFMMVGLLVLGTGTQTAVAAFDSGSTCIGITDPGGHDKCLGPFTSATNTVIQLPPDGILDYTTFFVPQGVTVRFAKNAANTPVIIRTTGNVTIEGIIDVSYSAVATQSGTAGDTNLGDDGQPGLGGPGGFDGGFGGNSPLFGGSTRQKGGSGKGPGGGNSGGADPNNWWPTSGSGDGGGGGGAIMIASSGIFLAGKSGVNGTGYILADGGAGGSSAGTNGGGGGGGGSGGAIKIVADTVNRVQQGGLYARGGAAGSGTSSSGGDGGVGIIRIESNGGNWSGNTTPAYSFALPGHVLVPNNPTLVITSVTPTSTGVEAFVPANPTGNADITFPEGTTTALVSIAATSIPVGTTVTVYVVPASGANRSSALSNALSGTLDNSTATATVTLSPGNNVLLASATYSVTEMIALNLPTFDDGIRVAKIRVESTMGGGSTVTYITASGKEYPADSPLRDKPKV